MQNRFQTQLRHTAFLQNKLDKDTYGDTVCASSLSSFKQHLQKLYPDGSFHRHFQSIWPKRLSQFTLGRPRLEIYLVSYISTILLRRFKGSIESAEYDPLTADRWSSCRRRLRNGRVRGCETGVRERCQSSRLLFGRPLGRLWYPMSSVVVCLSVTICIVAKRHILAKNCLKEQIG